jgi:hypothetical protein
METQFMDSTTTAADFQVGKHYELILKSYSFFKFSKKHFLDKMISRKCDKLRICELQSKYLLRFADKRFADKRFADPVLAD